MIARHEDHSPLKLVIPLDSLEGDPRTIRFEADEQACANLSRLYDTEACKFFRAKISTSRLKAGDIDLKIEFHTQMVRICVLSLDPFTADVQETHKFVLSTRNDRYLHNLGAMEDDPDHDVDYIDVSEQEVLDLGEILTELFVLSIDPYPKNPEIESMESALGFEKADNGQNEQQIEVEGEDYRKPFADLENLLKEKASKTEQD